MNADMTHAFKEMISRYVDGELTEQEKAFVEDLLKENRALYIYYQQLKQLDHVLNEFPVEETSSDWEKQVRASLVVSEGKKESHKSTVYKMSVGGGVLLTMVIMFFVTTQIYFKRGVQGRLKQATDDIGDQFSVGNTNVVKIMTTSPVLQMAATQPRSTGGLQESTYAGSHETFMSGTSRSQLLADEVTLDLMNSDVMNQTFEYWGGGGMLAANQRVYGEAGPGYFNTEEYSQIHDNEFLTVRDNPLSTFSIDVDTGSYSNIRRFLNQNQLPPADAVRIEEMLNYFSYNYRKPTGNEPFSINIDAAVAPWNKKHQLVRIGLQGKTLAEEDVPASNLVFLIDVSGSMNDHNKLSLVKQSLKMMVKQLTEKERIAMVVYAGNAGLVLESTPGSQKQRILDAIDQLQAGGSTAGGAGIQLAYKIAKENFIKGGNNRVILATDGDFNVGVSSTSEMTRLIEEKRDDGIFITVLGFGMGNYKDGRLEEIANQGNGTYHYIDTENEGRKVMVEELGSTLFTIAKDVKIQIEFNPQKVKAYRLIGYENRMLKKEDFNDDKKDAGELGAGHTVTALFEIVPADSHEAFGKVDDLTYQKNAAVDSDDLMTVKLRYKEPDGSTSKLITETVTAQEIADRPQGDFQFAAAVAEFGMLLRQSKFMGRASYEHVIHAAGESRGTDTSGYRQEFIGLVNKAASLDRRPVSDVGGTDYYEDDNGEIPGGLRFKGEEKNQ